MSGAKGTTPRGPAPLAPSFVLLALPLSVHRVPNYSDSALLYSYDGLQLDKYDGRALLDPSARARAAQPGAKAKPIDEMDNFAQLDRYLDLFLSEAAKLAEQEISLIDEIEQNKLKLADAIARGRELQPPPTPPPETPPAPADAPMPTATPPPTATTPVEVSLPVSADGGDAMQVERTEPAVTGLVILSPEPLTAPPPAENSGAGGTTPTQPPAPPTPEPSTEQKEATVVGPPSEPKPTSVASEGPEPSSAESKVPTPETSTPTPVTSETPPPVPPWVLPVEIPDRLPSPSDELTFKIIERSAAFLKKAPNQRTALETLRTSQLANPRFSFLNTSDPLHGFLLFLAKSDAQRQQQIILSKVIYTPIPPPKAAEPEPLSFEPPDSYKAETPNPAQSAPPPQLPPMRKAVRPNEIPSSVVLEAMQAVVTHCKDHGFALYQILQRQLASNPMFQFLAPTGAHHKFFDYLLLKNEVFDVQEEQRIRDDLAAAQKRSATDLATQLEDNKKLERVARAKKLMELRTPQASKPDTGASQHQSRKRDRSPSPDGIRSNGNGDRSSKRRKLGECSPERR